MRTAICPSVLRARLIRAGQGLRTEQDVDAERPALPHQAIQQQRGILRNAVVFDEEFLKFVDDQHRPRHDRFGRGPAKAGQVLHAGRAEQVGPGLQFDVEPASTLRPNSRSLSIATTRAWGK